MTNPSPRPALTTTKTGTRPAADRLAPLTSLPIVAPVTGALPDSGKVGKGEKDEPVELRVAMPKSVRKRVRTKAQALGYTPEEVTYRLLRAWLDA